MTNLKRRLDNVLVQLRIIREALDNYNHYPSCCLTVHQDGKISCGVIEPLPKERFLRECEKCRSKMKNFLDRLDLQGK